jgi:hypothetical protein
MAKLKDEEDQTANRTVYNRARRRHLNCAFCPPNQGENASGKRHPRADEYKTHRKGK